MLGTALQGVKVEHCSHCIPLESSPWDFPNSRNHLELLVRAKSLSSPPVLELESLGLAGTIVPKSAQSQGHGEGLQQGPGGAVPSHYWDLFWGVLGIWEKLPQRCPHFGRLQGQPGILFEHKSHQRQENGTIN